MSRRRGHRPGADAGALVMFVLACAVIAAIQVAEQLWPLLLACGAGYGGWRLWQARRNQLGFRGRVLQGRVLPDHPGDLGAETPVSGPRSGSDHLGDLEAENEELRRQVAKLEADAARNEEIVEALERVAGRPVEAILASCRKIAEFYGTGARP